MPAGPKRYAFNQTRQAYLATQVAVADTHWSRFWGLMLTDIASFPQGSGLWIVPCHGVHTLGMRFPIDVVYLDKSRRVVHLEAGLKPWRMAPVRLQAASILELPGETLGRTGTMVGDEIEIAVGQEQPAVPV